MMSPSLPSSGTRFHSHHHLLTNSQYEPFPHCASSHKTPNPLTSSSFWKSSWHYHDRLYHSSLPMRKGRGSLLMSPLVSSLRKNNTNKRQFIFRLTHGDPSPFLFCENREPASAVIYRSCQRKETISPACPLFANTLRYRQREGQVEGRRWREPSPGCMVRVCFQPGAAT